MTENSPARPDNAKGVTRAAMSQQLSDAHARGDVKVVIGRAADLVGPGVTVSSMGEQVMGSALAGKRAKTIGRLDALHTYSYAPDVACNLVLLGARDDAYGRVWHLPNPETLTTRQVITKVFAAADTKPRITTLKRPMLRAIGLVNRDVRGLLATYYQFDGPFVVADTAFTQSFGGVVTDWNEIVKKTLAYYQTKELRVS
jgi:nucleoside-diphosphate-sugar epimerase